MVTEQFQLMQCWKEQRIGQVFHKEATSVDTATFMATHTPLTKLIYEKYLRQMTDTTEDGLFNELQRCAENDLHAFVIIQGIPGTGKSHLIRWLKERYTSENAEKECVLFVARAQSSLRSTLEQIITSDIFDEIEMQDQLERLKSARIALSKAVLAETVLDQLRMGSIDLSEIDIPRWLKRKEKLNAFFLDKNVRQELIKKGGPIDRIVRFLSEGIGLGAHSSEIPQFSEHDFDFKDDMLRELKGYEDATWVAQRLYGSEGREDRETLARYLNRLLPYAIGHATALTSDDFKQIFFDLRRQLRKEGRNLALFIEDITALTGIDLGLLDVLATQHVGTTNQDLCRVISVIGITNNYFVDHFPDHMKDRVTHHLTLNSMVTNVSDSESLSDPDATAEMAARYLNAMRLEPENLQHWFQHGGKAESMPNACDSCPAKTACHLAFGYQRIVVSAEKELHLGLYPFNRTSLWKLYQYIKTSNSKRTPRSFLHNVLDYVLQSHGYKIKSRQFPPAPSDLGGDFTTFSLTKPLQRDLIAAQGKADAKRIETLVALWGDGTIDAYEEGQAHFVGHLSLAVFIAFGIKPIQGEKLIITSLPQVTLTPSNSLLTQKQPPADANKIVIADPSSSTRQLDKMESPPQDVKLQRYNDDIAGWLNGGQLQRYEDYATLLAPVIRSSINWNLHRVSSGELDEVLKARRRIRFEDQVGKTQADYYITFWRNQELANVLQAVVEIKEYNQALKPEVLSAHISNISIWLSLHEEEIVRFVRQPNHESTHILPLVTVLILDCLLLACLAGEFKGGKSSQDLLRDLIRFCQNTDANTWKRYQEANVKLRSNTWASIIKRIQPTQVEKLCLLLRNVLNCAQGESTAVLYIDAATVLNVLEGFQQTNWQLPPDGCIGTPLQPSWKDALLVYNTLSDYFNLLIQEERQSIQNLIDQLDGFIGKNSTKEVFQAISNMIEMLAKNNIGTNLTQERTLNEARLNTLLMKMHNLVKEQNPARLIVGLAQAGNLITSARDYITYFTDFEKEAIEQKNAAMRRLMSLKAQIDPEATQKQEKARATYQEIREMLNLLTIKEEAI